MLTRRAMLAGAAGLLSAPASGADLRSLAAIAAAKGFLFGSATANYEFKDHDFVPILAHDAAIIAPEYEMKRNLIEHRPGAYDFSALDSLTGFARDHGMAFRGHPLVWYAANPPWLADAVLARRDEKLLTGYVETLARRYRGRMHSLDVVNEALAPPGHEIGDGGWRQSFWLKAFGPAHLDLAFHAARAGDPTALLTYNDFGCEQGAPANDRFRANTLKLLDGLIARRAPVQALGLQAHLSAFGNKVDQKKLRAFLTEIEARGLAILVTELDVDDEGGPWDGASRDRAVADEAERFLDVVLDSRQTRAVLTWGLSDRYLDPPDSLRLKLAGWRGRKLPYDAQMQQKPLWQAMARAFSRRRVQF